MRLLGGCFEGFVDFSNLGKCFLSGGNVVFKGIFGNG